MSDNEQGEMQQPQSEVSLPIEWHIPDDVIRRYATNFTVQTTEHEYIVSFFDVAPPLLIGSPEEIEAGLRAMHAIRATCVARIVIARGRMAGFADIIQRSLQSASEVHEEGETE